MPWMTRTPTRGLVPAGKSRAMRYTSLGRVSARSRGPFTATAASPNSGSFSPVTESVEVAIVGAGMAGLSCADSLAHAGIEVRGFEAAEISGGRLASLPLASDSGPHLFDAGAQDVTAHHDDFRAPPQPAPRLPPPLPLSPPAPAPTSHSGSYAMAIAPAKRPPGAFFPGTWPPASR